jgi:two-component system chemotaxis sensor kinase CheA
MTDTDLLSYRDLFVETGREHIRLINAELANNSKNEDAVNEVYRRIHSLKGSSSIMGFSDISELCSKAGDLLLNQKEHSSSEELEKVEQIVAVIGEKIEEIKK